MMKEFRRPMTKVYKKNGDLKQYLISLGVNTEINEDLFHQNDKGKMVCDVVVCLENEFDKFFHEHGESQSKIQALETQLKTSNQLNKNYKNRLASIDEDHQKEIKKLKDEYSAKLNKLKDDLHEKELESERIKTKYEEEIGNLKEAHQKEINGLKLFDTEKHMSIVDHENQMKKLELFDTEKHMKIADHNEEISKLKIYNPESDMKISDHNSEVNGIKNSIVHETIAYNDKINEIDNIGLIRYLKGDLKQIKKDLKEGIEHFEAIAQYIESENGENIQDIKLKEVHEDSS